MRRRTKPYRIREFGALTGVTVRALQHYDRLGLLTPSRTAAGHRVYGERDRQRLRHIMALKAVGLSLQQIRQAVTAPASRLTELAAAQRQRARSDARPGRGGRPRAAPIRGASLDYRLTPRTAGTGDRHGRSR